MEMLDSHGVQRTTYRRRNEEHLWRKDYYDYLAEMIFELIFCSAAIKTNEFAHWDVQHNRIWGAFFSFGEGQTRKIVLFKLRRLLYNEVLDLERMPNYKAAKILGFLLNVSGLKEGRQRDYRALSYPIRKAATSWARRNYLWLVWWQHEIAAAVLIGRVSFDAQRNQLVKTFEKGLGLVAPTETLDLDQPIGPHRPVSS